MADSYRAITAHLAAPTVRVIVDWSAFVTPYTPPPDADFPPPESLDRARHTLARWPLPQAIFAATVAAEMVVPVWEDWVADQQMRPSSKFVHRALVRTAQLAAIGQASADSIADLYRQALIVHSMPYYAGFRHPAHWASLAALATGQVMLGEAPPARVVETAMHARALVRGHVLDFDAAEVPVVHPAYPPEFFADWWGRIRARMAFVDVATAEFDAFSTG